MRWLAGAVVTACLSLSLPVSAQMGAVPTEAAATRDVEVAIYGAQDPTTPLEPAIEEVARSLELRVVGPGRSARPLARAVIDLRGADVTLSVLDQDGRTVAQRSFPRGTTTEVLREELAIVLRDALTIAIARARPPEPTPAPTPPPVAPAPPPESTRPTASDPATTRVDLTTSFLVREHDPASGAVLGVGLGARVSATTGAVRPGLGATLEVDAPFDVSANGVDLRVAPYVARLLPSLEVPLGGPMSLDLVAGGGADGIHVTPTARDARYAARGSTTRWSPVLTAAVGAHARFGSTSVGLLGGVDADLARRSYVIDGANGPDPALSPSRARPFLMLTLAFAVHGGSGVD